MKESDSMSFFGRAIPNLIDGSLQPLNKSYYLQNDINYLPC